MIEQARRICIVGAYGGHNLGDEAILRSMVREIRSKCPSATVSVLIEKQRALQDAIDTYEDLLVMVLDRRSFRDVVRAARSEWLLLGGGQVITSRPKKLQAFQMVLVVLNSFLGGRSAVVGAGVESIDDFLSRSFVRYGLRPVRTFALRDENSLALLMSAGVPAHKLHLTADFVLSDWTPADAEADEREHVVLAVERSPGYATHDLQTWKDMLDAVRERHRDCVVHVVAHDQRIEFDMGLLCEIEESTQIHPDVRFHRRLCLDDLYLLYASSRVVYSSRLHPLILGLVGGADVVPVGGRSKVLSLLDSLGASDSLLSADAPLPLKRVFRPDPRRVGQLASLSGKTLDLLDL